MASGVTGKVVAEPSISGVNKLSAVCIDFEPGQGQRSDAAGFTGFDQSTAPLAVLASSMFAFTASLRR